MCKGNINMFMGQLTAGNNHSDQALTYFRVVDISAARDW